MATHLVKILSKNGTLEFRAPLAHFFGSRPGVGDHFPDLRVPSGFGLLGSSTGVGDHFPDLRVPSGFGLRDWGGGPLVVAENSP